MFKTKKHSAVEWLIIGVLSIVVVLLIAIAIPPSSTRRVTSPFNRIMNNLRQIDGAKEQFAIETRLEGTNEISAANINTYLKRPITSISGETYVIGGTNVSPEAHLTKAVGSLPAGLIISLDEIKVPGEPAMSIDGYFRRGEQHQHMKEVAIAAIVLAVVAVVILRKRRAYLTNELA